MSQYKTSKPITWAEIDLKAMEYNFNQVKRACKGKEIIPVIKANAYGHGMFQIASFLENNLNVKTLGVARVNEGVCLRKKGIKSSIIILGGFCKDEIDLIIKYNLEPSIFSFEETNLLNYLAYKHKRHINVHLKINTGMNRLGIRPEETQTFLANLNDMNNLRLKSIYTHLAYADMEKDGEHLTSQQIKKFMPIKNISGGVMMHAANSAAIAKYPFTYFDAVRPGIMLYGSYADKNIKKYLYVKPVMSLKSRIINFLWLKKGEKISYGGVYKAKKKERVAVIGIGYGDGFRRDLSGRWYVRIKGEKCPILGRICMDMTMVRIKKNYKVGDEVLIFGKDEYGAIDVEDMAQACGTISYEIFTGIADRVIRIYE
jgi:alanine racemase